MKSYKKIYPMVMVMLFALMACDENEVVPDHSVVGEAYATEVDFSISNAEPVAGETVQVILSYVNYDEDPIKSVSFFEEVDGGARNLIETIDESSAPVNSLVERTLSYTVPAASDVTIYVELKSAKEFPQVEKVSLSVQ